MIDHEKARREARLAEMNDLAAVLKTEEGIRVLRRLMARCGILQPSLSADTLAMARSEGIRYVGLSLLQDIREARPASFPLLFTRQDDPKPAVTEQAHDN